MMPECNMASSVILIVLVYWRYWLSSHLSTNCGWSPCSHRYAMTCDAILTRSPVEWNWTPMSQMKPSFGTSEFNFILQALKYVSRPWSGPWERGIHWSWVFPTHCVSSEWTSLSPQFVSEIFSIILSMASFVFRSILYYWNAKDNDHELHGLLFLTGYSGATLCGWNHVNHHLAVCRIHHPSITFRWQYPCGVCHHMFDQDPPFLKIFAGVGIVTVVTKEAGSG